MLSLIMIFGDCLKTHGIVGKYQEDLQVEKGRLWLPGVLFSGLAVIQGEVSGFRRLFVGVMGLNQARKGFPKEES